MTKLLEQEPASASFTRSIKRVAAIMGIGGALAGFVVAAWAGTWRSSSAGWRELAEQRAQQVEDLTKRVGLLEAQVRNVIVENENLRRINLEYQQVILEMRSRKSEH